LRHARQRRLHRGLVGGDRIDDYVFIPKRAPGLEFAVLDEDECCFALRDALRSDARYTVVRDDAGATIFQRDVD
jgi:hypothetical protein